MELNTNMLGVAINNSSDMHVAPFECPQKPSNKPK